MADRRLDLVRHLGASLSRRAGLATVAGAVARMIGIADIDAKKKNKGKKRKSGKSSHPCLDSADCERWPTTLCANYGNSKYGRGSSTTYCLVPDGGACVGDYQCRYGQCQNGFCATATSVCDVGCAFTDLQSAVDNTYREGTICLSSGDFDVNGGIIISKSVEITLCNSSDQVTIRSRKGGHSAFQLLIHEEQPVIVFRGSPNGSLSIQGSGFVFSGGVFNIDGFVSGKGRVEFYDLIVEGGNAYFGAGIYAERSEVHLYDTIVTGNVATMSGGGIEMRGGNLNLDGTSQVQNCQAVTGAGILLTDNAVLNLNGTSVIGGIVESDGNIATGGTSACGGGIYARDGAIVTMANTASIRYNVARDNGGGIYAEQGAILNGFANCTNIGDSGTIKDNTAANGSGSQIYHANTSSIC